jgi:two-component system phosphate regulon sensor histidine kinase PhoR
MKRFNRLGKFYLTYSLAFLGVLSLAGFVLQGELRRVLQDHLASDMLLLGRVLEAHVPDTMDPLVLDSFCQGVQERTGVRVTLVQRDGRVIGESNRPVISIPNHLERPEVRDALAGKTGRAIRRSETLGVEMMYVATLLPGKGLALRLAVPMKWVKAIENEVMFFLAFALYVTPILGIIIAFFFARSLTSDAAGPKRSGTPPDASELRPQDGGRGVDRLAERRTGGKTV